MANLSDTRRFKYKSTNRWQQVLMSQASRRSFIHSVTKQKAIVMNGLLISDSQIPSLTKHRFMLLGDDTDFIGTIIIS